MTHYPLLFSLGLAALVSIALATYQLVAYFNARLDEWAGLDDDEYREYRAHLKTTWFGRDIECWRNNRRVH